MSAQRREDQARAGCILRRNKKKEKGREENQQSHAKEAGGWSLLYAN